MMGNNKEAAAEKTPKTRNVQGELLEAQSILRLVSNTIYDLSEDVYRLSRDAGERLNACSYIIDDVEDRLSRVIDSEVTIDLEVAV